MSTVEAAVVLELDDIQNGVLHPRPSPYVGVYILLRIDDRRAGRELVRRLIPALADATSPADPSRQAWVSVALSLPGPQGAGGAAGLARELPPAVPAGHGRAGGGAGRRRRERAGKLGDSRSGRRTSMSRLPRSRPTRRGSRRVLARARDAYRGMSGITAIWRQDCYALPTEQAALRVQGRHQPSGRRGKRHPGDAIPRSRLSRRASSSWVTRTRRRTITPDAAARGPG